MSGCSYCGIPGHGIDVCPERLEEYYGRPVDNNDDSTEAGE